VVHLNDSGNGHGRDERVPIAAFEAAWATSHDYIVIASNKRHDLADHSSPCHFPEGAPVWHRWG